MIDGRLQPSEQAIVEAVLDFWFETDTVPGFCEYRPIWFEVQDPAFDAEVGERFLGTYEAAAAGSLDDLGATPEGALALVVVLDQMPRNMFRRQARCYATDAKALDVAREAIARGFDAALAPLRRWFLYLPFEHSEALADQHRAQTLFESLGDDPVHRQVVASAREHLQVIRRFDRFPHRNKALGRETTTDEAAFLAALDHPHLSPG